MPRKARIHYVSLRSSLVNLPISIYGPLLERNVRPQNLAVHLTLVAPDQSHIKTEAYVGWTGMASASSLAHFNSAESSDRGLETIEIDPQYAQGIGLAQGDVVDIGLLHDLPYAKGVATEPLTSDDWEIIELHASHVESTLLSQVRVAKIGQEINVWVLGRTRVRLRVVNIDPQSKSNALLLNTNTEVSIAPKLHKSQPWKESKHGKNDESASARLPNSTEPISKTEPLTKVNPQILRVIPARFLPASLPEYTGLELLAYVCPRTFLKLHPELGAIQDATSIAYHKHVIKRLPPPVDPSAATASDSPSGPTTRVLNPGNAEKDKQTPDGAGEADAGIIHVAILEGVPESHLALPLLAEGLEEWDLVEVGAVPDASSIFIEVEAKPLSSIPLSGPPPKFLAGVDEILQKCTAFCTTQFVVHSATNAKRGVSGLLVTGRSGAGKTSIVREVAKQLQESPKTLTYIHYVDVSRYAELPVVKLKELFHFWYQKASWHKPTTLILDNLDKILSPELEHADSFRARHLVELFLALYSHASRSDAPNTRGIILLGTASSTSALHPLINSSHMFQEVVNLKPPNKEARRDILSKITRDRLEASRNIQQDQDSPLNFTAVATQTEGYSAMDLQDLVARAVHQVAMRIVKQSQTEKAFLTSEDFSAAQVDFVPLSLRDVKLQKSDVAWGDIGGLHESKRILRETLEWPTKYGPIFAQSPLRLRSGLLLYGYPGCGKTLLASAVAKECGLNFISVKGPEVLNKYIGASEKSVRDLFERASAAKPCVLFFDEFDSIAPKRGHDSTGVTDRVVNQMLTQMDGAEGLEGVYVLAATSRPDLIDPALLRPGRLDKSILCGMPDLEERRDILKAVGRKVTLSPSIDLDKIAAATAGYSGADLQALVYNAHLEVIHAAIADHPLGDTTSSRAEERPIKYFTMGGPSTKTVLTKAEDLALQRRLRQIVITSRTEEKTAILSSAPAGKRVITEEFMHRVLKTMRPSVSDQERHRLERIYKAFVSDRDGDFDEPPEAGGVGNRVTLG